MRVPVLLLIVATSVALATASVGRGYPPDSAYQDGAARGDHDGRLAGREDGVEIGRSQALLASYFDGFRDGLAEADRSRAGEHRRRDAEDDGLQEGRRSGHAAGLAQGHARGESAASAAFARLEGRPTFRSEAPPPARDAPAPPAFDACNAPARVQLWLPRGRTIDIDPSHGERGIPESELRVPDAGLPSNSWLRQEARRRGWTSDNDLDAWTHAYGAAFDEAHEDVFLAERSSVSWSALRDFEEDGRRDGQAEGERRVACAGFERGFRRGHAEGFDEGFGAGFREGWDASAERHESGPVIRLESARLIDATGDGVFEPGEAIVADLVIANAGLVGVDEGSPLLAWTGIQSLSSQGSLDVGLGAQSRRFERIALGAIGAGAPLGATVILEIRPQRAAPQSLSALVGRPVVLDDVIVFLDVDDGRLALVKRGILRCVATSRVDRGLTVADGDAGTGAAADVGALEAGATRDVALRSPAEPESLDATLEAEMRLVGPDGTWMRRRASAETAMERATELTAQLAPGSGQQRAALMILSRRLAREFDAALLDPKLYKRLGSASELQRFEAALARSAPAEQRLLRSEVAAPLLARSRAKGIPRKVRSAIQDALDPS